MKGRWTDTWDIDRLKKYVEIDGKMELKTVSCGRDDWREFLVKWI